jgi:hypothetical protein
VNVVMSRDVKRAAVAGPHPGSFQGKRGPPIHGRIQGRHPKFPEKRASWRCSPLHNPQRPSSVGTKRIVRMPKAPF